MFRDVSSIDAFVPKVWPLRATGSGPFFGEEKKAMRKRFLAAVAAAAVGIGVAAPAEAITNGWPDGNNHPMVGLVVFYDGSGTPTHRCSGALISAKVFLTAGHCTFGAASAQVWFNEHVTTALGYPLTGGYTGTPHTYGQYTGALTLPNTGDVGVVVLRQRPNVGVVAQLADANALDTLAVSAQRQVTFDIVGYGLQDIRPTRLSERSRLAGTTKIVNLTSALTDGYNIHQSAAPGTGGGTCFGESGGPVFMSGTYTVVAVNSFVLNENCAGAGFAYRVDVGGANEFVRSFLR